MRISQNWLRKYISFKLRPEELAEKLGMLGLEVEKIDRLGAQYEGFFVGKILARDPHPNADKLSVCKVDVGKEILQIVCGAPNVAAGQKVAVGVVGATVPRNQHNPSGDPFVLSNVKIRGVESHGMICSQYELDLGNDADGIVVLDDNARVGQPLAQHLGLDDIIFEIEVTPNRPDWLSHFGVAREIGVIVRKQPKLPSVRPRASNDKLTKYLSVKVEDRLNCPRFAARMIRGITVSPSPPWLQNAIRSVGLRSRNNVVDVTNYVMLECGHPLHAFDYSLLKGGKIIVRQARAGKSFTALDGQKHELPEGAIVVCDEEREVSIAGIMGGANSEISETTADVVLEAACWNPPSIRRTARALGISTDASQRFERGADPNAVPYALNRAAQLISELAGGSLLSGIIDVYPRPIKERMITLRTERTNNVLGTSLPGAKVASCLSQLNITRARKSRGGAIFRVPTYRVDIEREVDLIEEVSRVYGYDKIDNKLTATIDFSNQFATSSLLDKVRETLIGFGYQEALSYSMVDEQRGRLGGTGLVQVLNPLGKEMSIMRTSLIPGLLDAVSRNQSFGNTNLRLFEIGRVFSTDSSARPKAIENILEEQRVGIILTGNENPPHWSAKTRPMDVFDLKGDIAELLGKIALDKTTFISYSTHETLAEDAVVLEINGLPAGYFGEIRNDVLKMFGIEQPVYGAELKLDALREMHHKKFQQLPRFPIVKRDVSFILDSNVIASEVEKVILRSSQGLLRSVELFDLYEGDPLPTGKKSMAFSLELMSMDRTLAETQIDAEMKQIIKGVEQGLGGSLRSVS